MNKVRFGVIGTNFITDWLIEGAKEDARFELSAVCSRSIDTGRAFAAKYGISHVFTSVEDMACSDCVDAVYVASPNFLHASQSIICMSHGKHVLCEKPLASNAVEARRMVEASRINGVCLMEAMKTTLTPNFKTVIEHMGDVGRVRRYFSSYCQYSSRYDRYKSGELPNAFNPTMSNGAIMDIGVYTIYPMVVLFGQPKEVIATGMLLPSGADGQGSAIFKYEHMDACVIYSKISDSALRSEIQGEEGVLSIGAINHMNDIKFMPRTANLGGGIKGQCCVEDLSARQGHNGYYYEVAEFISLVQAGKLQSKINSHDNSVMTMEIIDEIRRQIGVVFPADSAN